MRRRTKFAFLIFGAVLAAAFSYAAASGFYPVALVGSSPVFYRDWEKTEEAAENFVRAQIFSAGEPPPDFKDDKNMETLLAFKRESLSVLIEDKIVSAEGERAVSDFRKEVSRRVENAVSGAQNLKEGAGLLYGLELEDFKKTVLFPQARREILAEEMEKTGRDFSSWLAEAKKNEKVRILFLPFRWNGESVE